MNWFHRGEHRYVEYGSSFRAAQRFGIARQLTDTVYNMNRAHLSADTPTVFESLDDADLRTAGTTYLMYRGRHRHEPQRDTALTRVASRADAPPGDGPARAVLRRHLRLAARPAAARASACRAFATATPAASRATWSSTTCSTSCCCRCPTTTGTRTSTAPRARSDSIAQADLQLARVFDAAGGIDAFLRRARGDRDGRPLPGARRAERSRCRTSSPSWACSAPGRARGRSATGAPRRWRPADRRLPLPARARWSMRCARPSATRCAPRSSPARSTIEGVDLVIWLERDAHDAPREAVDREPRPRRAALRSRAAPSRDAARARVERRGRARGARRRSVRDGCLITPDYPDALARVWAALTCPTSGEVLLSRGPRLRVPRLGRARPTSAAAATARCTPRDSLGALVLCGVELPADARRSGRSATSRRSCARTSASTAEV